MRRTRIATWSAVALTASLLAACLQPKPFEDLMPHSKGVSGSAASNPPSTAPEASAPATISDRFVNDPARRLFTLTNGFTIILQQNKTAPVVAARVYVKAGALTEQEHMAQGISHVLEHLVAGASSGKRKEAENTLLLQQIGNDSNAYTTSDHTCYFITTTSDKWSIAADLLIDFTTNTDFTREEFNREFKVVQREIEMDEAQPDNIFDGHTNANRYFQSPARHPVIGYKSAFQKITYEEAKDYYHRMYIPDNMIISIAGDLDLDEAEKLIIDRLKDIPRKPVPSIALPPEPAVNVARRAVSFADIHKARIEWAFPTMDMYNPDLYATDALANVLGGSDSSLLVRRLRDELGLVTAINCSNATPSYPEGQLQIDAVLDPEKIPAAQEAVLALLDDVAKNGVHADALERTKAQVAADRVYSDQTAEQQASRNAIDFINTNSIDFSEVYTKRFLAVTPDQVLAMARKYIRPDHMLTTAVLPLTAKDPFSIAATTQVAASAVTVQKTILKNGITVLISKNTAAPLAAFNIYSLGGLLAEDASNNGIGASTLYLMTRGTETRTHEQIADFLDATGTTLSAESGNNSFALSMQCLKARENDAFALFADVALHPKFAADELEKVRPELLSAVDEYTEDWFGEAYAVLRDTYYASSPYKQLPVGKADVIAKLTPQALRTHYQNYFLDPKKMVISISGDIDPAAAAAWLAPFEAIPVRNSALQLTSTPAAPTIIRKHTDKQSATVMLAFPPGMKLDSPDRHAMILLQTYLGGYSSEGGSLLFDTLRGKGLVYTVSAVNFAGPASGMFFITALGEPKNASAILANIQSIIADVKNGNIPDIQVSAAKDQAITGEKLSRQTIAAKSSGQALDELLSLGFDDEAKFPDKIRAVTREDLIRVANTYLQNPIVVIMSPETPSDTPSETKPATKP